MPSKKVSRVTRRPRNNGARNKSLLDAITGTFLGDLKDPVVIIVTAAIAMFIATVNGSDFATTAFGQWCSSHKNVLTDWIVAHEHQFLGLLSFVPVVYTAPSKLTLPLAAGVMLWCMYVPQPSVYEYAAQAVLLHVFVRTRRIDVRGIAMLAGVALYAGGYLIMPNNAGGVGGGNVSTPQQRVRPAHPLHSQHAAPSNLHVVQPSLTTL